MNNLKRLVILAVVAVIGVGMANAEFRWGIKAGMNVNRIHIGDNWAERTFDAHNATGWTAGITTDFKVPVIGVGFDLSVMYSRMNNDSDRTLGLDNFIDYGKDFLEIPLHLKYNLNLPVVSSIVAPYIFTGPSFAIRLNKETIDAIKTKSCQVGWDLGLGLTLVRHLQIGAGYTWGINNIAKFVTPINPQTVKVKNNYWTLTAAYLF